MSDVENFIKEIEEKTEEINKVKQDLVDKLKPSFKDMFIPFLEKYPEIKRLSWTQYTPYFNDGEPCVFSVGDLFGFLDIEDECDYEGSLPIYDWYFNEEKDYQKKFMDQMREMFGSVEKVKELSNDFKSLQKAFNKIPEDIMEQIFGDHAKIIVTKDGLDVEEYDHD